MAKKTMLHAAPIRLGTFSRFSSWFSEYFNIGGAGDKKSKAVALAFLYEWGQALTPKEAQLIDGLDMEDLLDTKKHQFMALSAKERSLFIREEVKLVCEQMGEKYQFSVDKLTDAQVLNEFAKKAKAFFDDGSISEDKKITVSLRLGQDIELYRRLNANQKTKYLVMGILIGAVGLALLVCSVPLLLSPLGVAVPAIPIIGSALGMKVTMGVAGVISSLTGMSMTVAEGRAVQSGFREIGIGPQRFDGDYDNYKTVPIYKWVTEHVPNEKLLILAEGLQGACAAISSMFMLKAAHGCYKKYSAITENETLLEEVSVKSKNRLKNT